MKLLNTPVTNHMAVLEQKYNYLIDDKSSDVKQQQGVWLWEYFW